MNIMIRTTQLRTLFAKPAAVILLAALLVAAPFTAALAATAPSLGTAQSIAVLGASTVTNTGSTSITGDLGVSPGAAVTGFPPGTVTGGTIHSADAAAAQAQVDTTAAYNNLAGQSCNSDLTGQDLGGMTLLPGVYCFSTTAQLTGTLTLNAAADQNAVWVFKTGSTLTTASSSAVQLINSGQQGNVFWQVGSSATLGTGTTFMGNIIADTSITLNTGANISGRALARNGAVTMDANVVTLPPPTVIIPVTLLKSSNAAAVNPGQEITYTVTILNPNPFSINSVTAMDSMSPYTAWKLNSLQVNDGAPSSGLTFSSGLFSYSSDSGSTWSYVPVSGGGGQPAGYDGTVTNWKISPTGTMNGSNATFSIYYTVRAK
jgi:uncharacterized repeat protein (TIGR01451 family)